MTDFIQIDELEINDPNYVALRRSNRIAEMFNEFGIYLGSHREMYPDENQVVNIKKNVVFENYIFIPDINWVFEIGAFSYSYSQTHDIKVGRYCSIAEGLSIFGERHPIEHVTTSNFSYCYKQEWNKPNFLKAHNALLKNRYSPDPPDNLFGAIPLIEHDVWIGANVQLARNINIGSGAVIGAGAVVTKDVAPYTIVGGNPARIIRERFRPEVAVQLLNSQWWNYHPEILFEFDRKNPERFLEQFEEARANERLLEAPIQRFDWKTLIQLISTR